MLLAYSDGRPIGELTDVQTARPIGHAPLEFSAELSLEAAATLRQSPAAFYRAAEGDDRFTVSIDRITVTTIAGTIRRR